jgi:RNA polymerase sigma factor (TIGR02999 family)
MDDVTQILTSMETGDGAAAEALLQAVYAELRHMAKSRMAGEATGHTLQATALVHEAWLRLVKQPAQSWQNRAHFFGAAANAMRRILIERARRKNRQRRGSGAEHLDIDGIEIAGPAPDDQLLQLDEALQRFAVLEPRQAELVNLRFFVGLTIEEAAQIMGISPATAKRWWAYARAWLFVEINRENEEGGKADPNPGNRP